MMLQYYTCTVVMYIWPNLYIYIYISQHKNSTLVQHEKVMCTYHMVKTSGEYIEYIQIYSNSKFFI